MVKLGRLVRRAIGRVLWWFIEPVYEDREWRRVSEIRQVQYEYDPVSRTLTQKPLIEDL